MERFRSRLFLLKWRAHDHVKYRSHLPTWLFIAAWAMLPWARGRRWKFLLAAHRQSYNRFAERRIVNNIAAITEYARRAIAPGRKIDGSTEEVFYKRAIILKRPIYEGGHLIEKGVLLVKFTDSFVYLHRHFDTEALLRKFYLVLEPSRSGYAQPPILAWCRFRQPILVQASEARDRALLDRLGSNLVPMELGSSNWVDHRTFRPLQGCQKEYDAVLVSDAGLAKRVHVYLRAVARIADPHYRCALVVGNWGSYKAEILSLIRWYRLGDKVTVYSRMNQEELNVLLNKSKVNVLLSLKEGSNRLLFEGFFAGVPGLLLRENVGVNKDYFNEQTGMIVDERELPQKLRLMKETWQRYRPRQWAMEHIAYERSTEVVASRLARIAEQEGLAFSGPLYEKVNVPEACYPDDPDGTIRRRLIEEYLSEFAIGPDQGSGDRPAPAWGRLRHDRQVGA